MARKGQDPASGLAIGSARADPGVVLTADVTYCKDRATELKPIVEAALADNPGAVKHVVVLEREPGRAPLNSPRELTWPQFLEAAEGHGCAHVAVFCKGPAQPPGESFEGRAHDHELRPSLFAVEM